MRSIISVKPAATAAVILLVLAVLVAACGPVTTQAPPPPSTNPPISTEAAGAASLALGELRVELNNDPSLNYKVIATVINGGTGVASGFNAGCTYQCPAGDTVTGGGFDIVQGGNINPNDRFTYQSPFHFQCSTHPTTVNLTCTIDSAGVGTQTFSVPNVPIP